MPIHDFQCRACGHRFEALVRNGLSAACPRCGASDPDKQISAPAAPGHSKAIIASARRQAAREGHMSHYSAAERKQLLR